MSLTQSLSVRMSFLQRAFLIVVCVAIAIGIFARAATIVEVGMWNEELHSLRLSDPARSVPELIEARVAQEGPPLYQMFLYATRKLGGDSEAKMRLVQNVVFMIGVLLLWTQLNPVPGVQVRLIQSGLLIGSYGMVYFSSELRSYALIIFLAIPQSLLLLRILLTLERGAEISHRSMAAFAIVSGALGIVHYVATVAVATSFALLAMVALAKRDGRGVLMVMSYGLAACAPAVVWFVATRDPTAFEIRHVLADPTFMVRQIDRFFRVLAGSIAGALCLAILAAAAAWTAVRALRQGSDAPLELKAALWLGAYAVATWLAAFAVTILIVPVANMKTLLVTAPPIYLGLACVISFWLKSGQKIARSGVAVALLYLVIAALSTLFEFEPNLLNLTGKKDWVVSAQVINELEECVAQPIVVVANRAEFYHHYIDRSKNIDLVPIGIYEITVLPGGAGMEERAELRDDEVIQARELARTSNCGVKMWYVPTAVVSEKYAMELGEQILGGGNFKLERVGDAMLFHSQQSARNGSELTVGGAQTGPL
jgi:mannosyltransferase